MSRYDDPGLDSFIKRMPTRRTTPEEEKELSKVILAREPGWEKARDELVLQNMPFAISIAKKYLRRGILMGELVGVALEGLARAAEDYDGQRGAKFISYAVWWIRQAIRKAFRDRLIYLPENYSAVVYLLWQKHAILSQKLGREPNDDELADFLGWSIAKVREVMSEEWRIEHLDEPFDHDDERSRTLASVVEDRLSPSPEEDYLAEELHREVLDCLQDLPEREAEIICLLFGIGFERNHTLEEIGQRFGLTRERVRQIKEQALRRMRYKGKRLHGYLKN